MHVWLQCIDGPFGPLAARKSAQSFYQSIVRMHVCEHYLLPGVFNLGETFFQHRVNFILWQLENSYVCGAAAEYAHVPELHTITVQIYGPIFVHQEFCQGRVFMIAWQQRYFEPFVLESLENARRMDPAESEIAVKYN